LFARGTTKFDALVLIDSLVKVDGSELGTPSFITCALTHRGTHANASAAMRRKARQRKG
jgi:hypothetical protein